MTRHLCTMLHGHEVIKECFQLCLQPGLNLKPFDMVDVRKHYRVIVILIPWMSFPAHVTL